MVYYYLWCFSILVNYYFQVSFSFKVVLYVSEEIFTQQAPDNLYVLVLKLFRKTTKLLLVMCM